MKLFLTYDTVTNTVIQTTYDSKQDIFYDPVTQKVYDYPYVFTNLEDMHKQLPQVIKHLIYQTNTKIQQLEQYKSNLAISLIQNTDNANTLYYYIDYHSLIIKAATKQNGTYVDILTNVSLPTQTYYTSKISAYDVLYPHVRKIRKNVPPMPVLYNWQPDYQ